MNKAAKILSGVAVCLCACAPKHADYSRVEQLGDNMWLYERPVSFAAEASDSVTNGSLTVAVRHNDTYPFRNLWLEISRRDTQGKRYTDTVNMQLADVYGHWLGKGIGGRYQSEITVAENFNFSDSANVTVRHIMRVDTLAGITDIGVTIRSKKP